MLAALGPGPLSLCPPGPHPALRPLLTTGFRIHDYDITMTTSGLTLPATWIYSPGLG